MLGVSRREPKRTPLARPPSNARHRAVWLDSPRRSRVPSGPLPLPGMTDRGGSMGPTRDSAPDSGRVRSSAPIPSGASTSLSRLRRQTPGSPIPKVPQGSLGVAVATHLPAGAPLGECPHRGAGRYHMDESLVYTHVLNRGCRGVRSPVDSLGVPPVTGVIDGNQITPQ